MKLRAVMKDPQHMRELQNIVQTLTKLSKTCVMDFSPECLHFIANEESGCTAPLIWIDIDAKLYLNEYTIENGKDDMDPHIMVCISTANIGRALAQIRTHTTNYCKFKMTHNQFPCLTIELQILAPNSEHTRQSIYDVPIEVIPRSDWPYFKPPRIPNCQLILSIPLDRKLRSILERLKNLSPTVVLHATSKGELNLVSETELATVTTRFRELDVQEINQRNNDREFDVLETKCTVDCKKASLLVNALHMPTSEMACGIDDEHLIHMEVIAQQGVTVHSILPAVCME